MTVKTDNKTMVAARDLKVGDYFRHGGKFFRVQRSTVADASSALDAGVVARAVGGSVKGHAAEMTLIPDTGVERVDGAQVLAAQARQSRDPFAPADGAVVVDNTRRSPAGEVSPKDLAKWLAAQARGQR